MKDQIEMFPTLTGERLRDQALNQVAENAGPWSTKALLTSLFELERRHGQRMNGERLRHIVVDKIGEPHDPHVWGSLVMSVRRKFPGLLVPDGMEKPQDPASKACKKQSYIVNANWRGR